MPADKGERSAATASNVLDRQFVASAPNRKWIADFTYIWTAEGWLYVAVVIDLFSRRVVGWSMSATMTAQLVTDALVMAIWRRGKPDALLHHSDRGSQYTSEPFQRLMKDHGVVCSMSRSGNVWDNAAMESFFSSMKTERIARKVYRTRDQARADVNSSSDIAVLRFPQSTQAPLDDQVTVRSAWNSNKWQIQRKDGVHQTGSSSTSLMPRLCLKHPISSGRWILWRTDWRMGGRSGS